MRTFFLLCFVVSVTGCVTNLGESLHPATAFSLTRPSATNNAAEPSAPSRIVGSVNVDHFTNAPLQRLKKVRLSAPVQTVFDYVGDHERMPEWIPLMHRVSMDHQESQNGSESCGVGSVRTCEIRPDKIREKIVIWEPHRMFAYRVIDGQRGIPIDGGFGLITFEEQGPRQHPDDLANLL